MEHPDLHKSVNCEVYVVTFFRRLTFQSLLLRFAIDQFVPSGFSEYFPSKTFIQVLLNILYFSLVICSMYTLPCSETQSQHTNNKYGTKTFRHKLGFKPEKIVQASEKTNPAWQCSKIWKYFI